MRLFTSIAILFLQSIFVNTVYAEESTTECVKISDAFERRLCIENKISDQPFILIPYKPNYFVGSYVDDIELDDPELDNFEAKFQISFKIPLSNYKNGYRCLWVENTHCYTFLGYTQLSVWQMLNLENSAPFRDTNFEPELMITQLMNWSLFGNWKLRMINYGLINHQSNGKSSQFSRSWNRSTLGGVVGDGSSYVGFKYWKRWNEKEKSSVDDLNGDDNPFIEDYVGNFEIEYFHAGDFNNFSVRIRDSKNNSGHMNYELGWSYPLNRRSKFKDSDYRFYVQYFNGFGETLIDYDVKRERISVGFMLTDWL